MTKFYWHNKWYVGKIYRFNNGCPYRSIRIGPLEIRTYGIKLSLRK